MAYRILVPQPGMEPGTPAVEALSPNHWNTREFSYNHFLFKREFRTSLVVQWLRPKREGIFFPFIKKIILNYIKF